MLIIGRSLGQEKDVYKRQGHYYKTSEGTMEGLSLVDLHTEQGEPRLIDNIVLENEKMCIRDSCNCCTWFSVSCISCIGIYYFYFDISSCNRRYFVTTVSYTHLDVYKRQVYTSYR